MKDPDWMGARGTKTGVYGKNGKKEGRVPAVALVNPRFPHNVGAAVRAASCFGIEQVWFSGDRVHFAMEKKRRMPREERMKGFREVELRHFDAFYDQFENVTPVAVEILPQTESLFTFEHPKNALYVFGPEDGTLGGIHLQHCHRFVAIPTRHCVNLAAAVYLVLYDRARKLDPHATIHTTLAEDRRSFPDNDNLHKELGLEGS